MALLTIRNNIILKGLRLTKIDQYSVIHLFSQSNQTSTPSPPAGYQVQKVCLLSFSKESAIQFKRGLQKMVSFHSAVPISKWTILKMLACLNPCLWEAILLRGWEAIIIFTATVGPQCNVLDEIRDLTTSVVKGRIGLGPSNIRQVQPFASRSTRSLPSSPRGPLSRYPFHIETVWKA